MLSIQVVCCILVDYSYSTRILYQTLPVHSYFSILFESSTASQQSAATPPLSRFYTSSYTRWAVPFYTSKTQAIKPRDYTLNHVTIRAPSLSPESVRQIKNRKRSVWCYLVSFPVSALSLKKVNLREKKRERRVCYSWCRRAPWDVACLWLLGVVIEGAKYV